MVTDLINGTGTDVYRGEVLLEATQKTLQMLLFHMEIKFGESCEFSQR